LLDAVGSLNKSQIGVRPVRAGVLVLFQHENPTSAKWSPLMGNKKDATPFSILWYVTEMTKHDPFHTRVGFYRHETGFA
jgi:hypothetical protein